MNKQKRKLISILASLIFGVYPLFFAATAVYADDPALPAAPALPATPDLPGTPVAPDQPILPSQEPQPVVLPTDSGTNPPSGHHHDRWDPSSSNSNTGADSTNNANTTGNNSSDGNINNEAGVDNIISVDSLTGDSSADKNTGDGSVTSGNASASGSLKTSANGVSLGSLECPGGCGTVSLDSLNSSNSQTGSGSENNSSTATNNNNSLDINNGANLDNLVNFGANSGHNSASKNTGNGTVNSGDADVVLTAINTPNNVDIGYEAFNVYDDQTGDLVIDYNNIPLTGTSGGATSANSTTGADSTNNATTNSNNTNTLLVDNNGNIINNYQLGANTGDNTAEKNTGDGSITTGDANVDLNLINLLNNVFSAPGQLLLGVVNIFGTLTGNIVLQGLDGSGGTAGSSALTAGNSTTGADSTNNASSALNNGLDASLNNSAQVLNNVTLNATTGNNDASKNTGSGNVSTGDVAANLKVTNVANTNTVGNGGTIWMVLVNNLGTWTGQLFNGDSSSGAYSPFFTFTINPDGSLSASNDTTGTDSSNNASTVVSNDTNIAITNTAAVENNVTINANTGGNNATKNTGNGNIQTGNVNVAANIINLINNNFIGARFAVTIVNIFGKFLGNIQQGGSGQANITVGEGASIALSANAAPALNSPATRLSTNHALAANNSQSSNDSSTSNNNKSALVLGANHTSGGSNPVSYFNAKPGLLDGFRLEYLLIPLFFGVFLTLARRAFKLR